MGGFSNPVNIPLLSQTIAQEILQSGVPLIGQPSLLYNLPGSPLTGAGPIGATVFPDGYNLSDYIQAANLFDSFLKNQPLALTCQKWYLTPGSFILNAGQIPNGLQALINAGVQIILSIKPSQNLNATDYANVTTTINVVKAAGATNLIVCLWNEPNQTGKFPSAQAYIDYVNYYIGAVRAAGISTIAYIPVVYTNSSCYTYYPGDANVGLILCDYYGDAYNQKSRLDVAFGGAAGSMMSLADNHLPSPIPFGIGEWGVSADNTAHPKSLWIDYWNYLLNLFATRLNNGKTNGPIMWYSGHNVNGTNILPNGPGYDLTAGILAVYGALSNFSQLVTIGAGQTITLTPVNPSTGAGFAFTDGLSYELTANLVAAAGSTNPFDIIRIEWFNSDTANAPSIKPTQWSLPAAQAGSSGSVIGGVGPERGQYMRIQITNTDTVAHTLTLQLTTTGRSVAGHDWFWDAPGSAAIPGFTMPGGSPDGNMLGAIVGPTIGANSFTSRLLSMFSGEVSLRIGGTTQTVAVTLIPQPQSVWGAVSIFNANVAAGQEVNQRLILPRAPCQLTLTNQSATNSTVVFAAVTALDIA